MKENQNNCQRPCSKILCSIFFIALGVGGTLLYQHVANAKEKTVMDEYFKEAEEMEKSMNQIMEKHRKALNKAFKETAAKNSAQSFVTRNDDEENFVYELTFSGFSKDEVSAEIKDNMLVFSGAKKNKKDAENYSSSNFFYSFSLPEYDYKKSPNISKEEGRVVVKLAKKKSSK